MVTLIHLPRTAGTFLQQLAKNTPGLNSTTTPHKPAKDCDKTLCLIGIIRNPFDWYVSRYEYFRNTRPCGGQEKGVSNRNDLGYTREQYNDKYISLKQSIMEIVNIPEYVCEKCGHINEKPPKFWLYDMYKYMFCDSNNILLLKHVIKFEKLSTDLPKILKQYNIGLSTSIDKMTYFRNQSDRKPYQEYYDEELKEIIYQKDKFIFDTYGYTF